MKNRIAEAKLAFEICMMTLAACDQPPAGETTIKMLKILAEKLGVAVYYDGLIFVNFGRMRVGFFWFGRERVGYFPVKRDGSLDEFVSTKVFGWRDQSWRQSARPSPMTPQT